MKIFLAVFIFLFFPICLHAQIGGLHTYEFLNLVSNPLVASLGGKNISSPDNDLSLVYQNPALLNEQMNSNLTLNYVNYFADIKYGYATYATNINKKTFAVGMQYINYGNNIAADENGTITGSFKAADYALNVAYSQPIDSFFSIGADVRPIISILENYQSFGLSSDIGVTWKNVAMGQTVALVVRNLGTQIKPYYQLRYESLPFEIQAGYTQKLKYAPFRFSITLQHLETPDMSVTDFEEKQRRENTESAEIQTTKKRQSEVIADGIMRHVIVGVEFIPVKNFFVRAGYNYQRRQELKIGDIPGFVGFSWGVGLTIRRFQISYGRARYNFAAATNHFAIGTNLDQFYQKK